MRRVFVFAKKVMCSRIGQILLVAHLILVVFDFSYKKPLTRAENNSVREASEISSATLIAGRGFHYHYESDLLKFLVFIDTPGIIISFVIGLLLTPLGLILPPLGYYDESWVAAFILLCGTSVQWQLVGYCIERCVRRKDVGI